MNCKNCQSEMNRVGQRHLECKTCNVIVEVVIDETAIEPNASDRANTSTQLNAPKQNASGQKVDSATSNGCVDGIVPLGNQTDFMCPTCEQQNLHVATINGTQICFCNSCRGFVVDRASFGELIESLRSAYDGPETAVAMDQSALHLTCNCPACFEEMETFPYYGPGNVVIDSCEGCKLTWLNQGELAAIVRAPGKRDYSDKPAYIAIPKPGGSGICMASDTSLDVVTALFLMG